jgi:hypothetical protein
MPYHAASGVGRGRGRGHSRRGGRVEPEPGAIPPLLDGPQAQELAQLLLEFMQQRFPYPPPPLPPLPPLSSSEDAEGDSSVGQESRRSARRVGGEGGDPPPPPPPGDSSKQESSLPKGGLVASLQLHHDLFT